MKLLIYSNTARLLFFYKHKVYDNC